MADPGYFSIRINISPGNDACIIFVQPSQKCLQTILDDVQNIYSINEELHKELLSKTIISGEKDEHPMIKVNEKDNSKLVEHSMIPVKEKELREITEQPVIEMIEMEPKEEVVKVEVNNDDPENSDLGNFESIIKISCFAFYDRKCHFCYSEFTSDSDLSEHFYEKHEPSTVPTSDGKNEYQCRGCGKKFSNYPWAVKHCRVSAKKIFQCPKCKTNIKQKQNVKRHMEKCSGAGPFFCPKCHHFSKYKSHYDKHLLRCGVKKPKMEDPIPSNPEDFINCHDCDFRTLYPHIMKRHMTIEHTKVHEGVKCDKCVREFVSVSGLQKHQLKVHGHKQLSGERGFVKIC